RCGSSAITPLAGQGRDHPETVTSSRRQRAVESGPVTGTVCGRELLEEPRSDDATLRADGAQARVQRRRVEGVPAPAVRVRVVDVQTGEPVVLAIDGELSALPRDEAGDVGFCRRWKCHDGEHKADENRG